MYIMTLNVMKRIMPDTSEVANVEIDSEIFRDWQLLKEGIWVCGLYPNSLPRLLCEWRNALRHGQLKARTENRCASGSRRIAVLCTAM
jgi:hypothetical protein